MLFTSKGFVAVRTLVHTFYLLSTTVAVNLAVAVVFLTDNIRKGGWLS
jgi:hypothetical protein